MPSHALTSHRAAASLALTAALLVGGCAGRAKSEAAPAPGAGRAAATSPDSAGPGRVATARDWEGRTNTRVEELFAGRFPGVQVFQASGGLSVRIRGATSLRGSNEPLYIVDGFPYTPTSDGLIALNPSDIARIEVLKDAVSMAYYGVRGGNGVVLITTKRR